MSKTIRSLLDNGAADAVAVTAPDGVALTFGGLRQQVDETIAAFNAAGIGRNDRVAIVLPNGPEMAAAFLAIAAGTASAPLNSGYRAEEFEFYLSDLKAKAMVIEAGAGGAAVEAAQKLGVPLVRLTPTPERGAGRFTLDMSALAKGTPASSGAATAEDIALVLHTSGTTSRPKIVPLSQTNLAASARNIGAVTRFTAQDRGLVIMPLFHIHGLIAGVLAPLAAGGSVFCPPGGFNALKFFGWMRECKPTWYTAVPTMHQAILTRASKSADVIAANPLRFIRSSSSSLPPQVLAELEQVFGTRVIESYGMTEAAHQMASNLLAPGQRKPGTVGVAAGPDVAIMDTVGNLLPHGATGEIVIRGENVTPGYENNTKANGEAFTGGWFRTGDQGVMDDEGFISITGRLKEIINRGGEKISPREVDEVLMNYPAVQQVVTFGIPHDKLGEEVGAVVVLREGQQSDERALRDFAAKHLADFKVPRKILFMAEIPKGATGKLQRIGLAAKLGL